MSNDLNIQLIERCIQGDVRAQRELFDRYVEAMYNTVLRIVPESMEAEDILQEGFIKAFAHLKKFKGQSTFGAWLKGS